MSDYFSILSPTQPLNHDGVLRLARLGCLELHRVQWLRSYLATDGTRMLCTYRAPDAESVRLVLRQQGFTDAIVWLAKDGNTDDTGRLDTGRPCVVVEFDVAAIPDAAGITSTRATIVAALEAAGNVRWRIISSPNGARLLCTIDCPDKTVVSRCLPLAEIAPRAVWQSIELDPRPPKLFRSDSVKAMPAARWAASDSIAAAGVSETFDAVIVGAGVAGINMLQRLVQMELRVRVYECANEIGGVWYWNRYPGARVDSETYTYGFSFSEELLEEWEWHELFAAQPEIVSYLRYVVDRLDLRRYIHLNTRLDRASYDSAAGRWLIETSTGERVTARYLIAAVGVLSTPQMPDYLGMDEFSGESYHTARWPVEGVNLVGKRVGVIGTGASGVQVIQTIAERVHHLTVFQRTPTYCIPQRNRHLTDDDRRQIRCDWEKILASCRESYGGFLHSFDPRSGLSVSAEAREAKFEELWRTPGFAFWFGNFADLMMNAEVNAHASDFIRRKIRARVRDPDVARMLLPDHPFGTKRVPLENGYYEVYNRGNVRLVDLRKTPIERITKDGIRTSHEEHPLDIIVYATGFDAGTGSLIRINIRGERGVALADKWRRGPTTYLGLLVSGFPNLFIVNGPHNAAALCNAGRCIEQNVDWIARCIEHMRTRGLTRVAPTVAAEAEWTQHVEDVAEASLLGQMRDSWFFGANTPGKARRVAIYAAGAREYREHCEDVAQTGYPGLTMS